jgi:16S rRNA (cytosine1402-N4)-methyltransferase
MEQPAPSSAPRHVPVLPMETMSLLQPAAGEVWVDATTGTGGHSVLIAERIGPEGKLICLDQDRAMLELAREQLRSYSAVYFQTSFENLPAVLRDNVKVDAVDGILADLGFCSVQMDDPQRGLSFQKNGPLDMRLNPEIGKPASWILQTATERDLADIFYQFGEERFSYRIARRIVEARKTEAITTTGQLADLVRRSVPRPKNRFGAIDPATRVFQALRIAVNDELGALERFLSILPECLKPGGRVGVISFHSLEDRLVKRAFREQDVWEQLTRKPVQAGDAEIAGNPRSRSAKFRAARKK